ncbi:type VI secretion system tip protein VgrG [Chitinophaga sp.]|uniref:type VI secretion system tip protein VgrG n=1 Tax=Chitinophaga sp. TaxID=1869181 RepID=UPI0031E1D9ED
MPAPSPANIQDVNFSFSITVAGNPVEEKYPFESITIVHEVNRISYMEIVIAEGLNDDTTGDTGNFPISEGADFIPGKEIAVSAAYGTAPHVPLFKGLIVKQAITASADVGYKLIVTCKHKAVTMTYNRKECEFDQMTDSDIMSKLAGNYGLSATVSSTTSQLEGVFQKMATDWDFLLTRAAFNGYVTTMYDDNITIGPPDFSTAPVLYIAMGDSIIDFKGEVNAEKQPPTLQTAAWDPGTLALITANATEPTVTLPGNQTASTLSGTLNQQEFQVTSTVPLVQADLKTWADNLLLRTRMSAVKGQVSFLGNSAVKPGAMITLNGVGARFNGDAYVSMVRHTLEEGDWTTTVGFGLSETPIYDKEQYAYSNANGQVPPVHGLQLATVVKISEDPGATYRVQVKPVSGYTAQKGIWARLASYYATSKAGMVFSPEVGDEVILGFLENDTRYPIILGSLYSKANVPPLTQPDEKNNIKALYTRSQLQVSFDDDKKIVQITTPGKNTITVSDDAKGITLEDQNNNSVKLDDSGITLNSAKDIVLKATGNITLNATAKLTGKAAQDLELSGMNIKQTAQIGLTAQGSASAELSASGQTVIKGGIVMIN